MNNDYQERIARLQALLREQSAVLAILAGTDQMTYLTGWREGGHERFVGLFVPANGEPAFVVPAMNALQAEQTPAGIKKVIGWDDATGWHDAASSVFFPAMNAGHRSSAEPGESGPDALVDDELHSVHLLALQDMYPFANYEAIGPTMARLREIKTPQELDALTQAAQMIDAIYTESLNGLREGITESEFQAVVADLIKRERSRPSFTPLICFGANAALPHHHSGDAELKRGDIVTIDIGCVVNGYASDITRMASFGPPSYPDAAQIYRIVYQAHHAARNVVRPGVTGEQVDAAARNVIAEAGYGPQFLHRTGHGIGLSTHEPPNMVAGNTAPLAPGMCFSVEPGIYLPGRFGIRIENIVTVTDDGCRSLNAEPPAELPVI